MKKKKIISYTAVAVVTIAVATFFKDSLLVFLIAFFGFFIVSEAMR